MIINLPTELNSDYLRNFLKFGHHLSQGLLPLGQLATPGEVHAEQGHHTVHYEQFEDARLLMKLSANEVEKFHLLFAGIGAAVENVVQHGLLVQVVAIRDWPAR